MQNLLEKNQDIVSQSTVAELIKISNFIGNKGCCPANGSNTVSSIPIFSLNVSKTQP